MNMKKFYAIPLCILLLLGSCSPSAEGPMAEKQGVFGRQPQAEEAVTNAVRQIQEEELETLEITPWGEMASDPHKVETGTGYGVKVLDTAVYESLAACGLTRDQLFVDGTSPKPDYEEGEEALYSLRDLVQEDGELLEGFRLLMLEVEVTNLKTEGREDSARVNLAGVALTRPEDLVVVEEEELVEAGVKYSSQGADYSLMYLNGSVGGEKGGYTVAVEPGESCTVQLGYLVPEDWSGLIGIVGSSGHYSGGFFALTP